jgi:hypothetical protein
MKSKREELPCERRAMRPTGDEGTLCKPADNGIRRLAGADTARRSILSSAGAPYAGILVEVVVATGELGGLRANNALFAGQLVKLREKVIVGKLHDHTTFG